MERRGLRFSLPSEGDVVGVLYDSKSQNVKFDASDPRLSDKGKKAEQRKSREHELEVALSGSAGSSLGADDAGSQDARAAAFRASRIRGFIARAEESGDRDEVERLTAMLTRVEAGDLSLPDRRAGGIGPSEHSADRLDRLQKLANLHQTGTLSDAEFEAEKAKILSET